MTTLELRADRGEFQIRYLSRENKKESRAVLRSFLTQMRPWLHHFRDPIISHSDTSRIKLIPSHRQTVRAFKAAPVSELSGSFGYKIRQKRTELGLTQETFARALNIHRSHLSEIERGIHIPQRKTRIAIEEILRS